MDHQHMRKIDDRQIEYLIHKRLFFTPVLNADDPEPEIFRAEYVDRFYIDVHRDMFQDWRGNLDDLIRKKRFGGSEETTQSEIDAWRNSAKAKYEVSENLLWNNHFSDRDEATVTWADLDEARRISIERRRAAEKAEKAEKINVRNTYENLSDNWPAAFGTLLFYFPTSVGYWLVS